MSRIISQKHSRQLTHLERVSILLATLSSNTKIRQIAGGQPAMFPLAKQRTDDTQ